MFIGFLDYTVLSLSSDVLKSRHRKLCWGYYIARNLLHYGKSVSQISCIFDTLPLIIGYIEKDVIVTILAVNFAQEKSSEIVSSYIMSIKL